MVKSAKASFSTINAHIKKSLVHLSLLTEFDSNALHHIYPFILCLCNLAHSIVFCNTGN